MSDESPAPPEEVQQLARDLELLRSDFQTALAKLNQMDERLRASFPQLRKPGKKEKSRAEIPPRSMTSGQLLAIFDRLVALKREKGDSDFESRLRNLPPEDAVLLALDLGAGKGKKITLKAAQDGIRRRVNEIILLDQNQRVAGRTPQPPSS